MCILNSFLLSLSAAQAGEVIVYIPTCSNPETGDGLGMGGGGAVWEAGRESQGWTHLSLPSCCIKPKLDS